MLQLKLQASIGVVNVSRSAQTSATSQHTRPFLPVIIGTDLNAYYMARSFNDAYNIRPLVIGKQRMGFTANSSILDLRIIGDLWNEQLLVKTLIDIAREFQSQYRALVLVATNDFYVRMIVNNATTLRSYYRCNYVDPDILDNIQIKSNFYQQCELHDIAYPQTVLVNVGSDEPIIQDLPQFPIIVKPANGDMYYRHKFTGQEKVYRPNNRQEFEHIVQIIAASGYTDSLICQEFIPGDDTYLYDMVVYVDSKGHTRSVSFAQVLLQEHQSTAIGNLTALVTRYDPSLMKRLSEFAEQMHFVGFGNFDIKFDVRDKKFKVLELNVRQGRSSYYMEAQGSSMARLLVEDVVEERQAPVIYHDEHRLFSIVPLLLVLWYSRQPGLKSEILKLACTGRVVNPLRNPREHSLKRLLWRIVRHFHYYYKYLRSKW